MHTLAQLQSGDLAGIQRLSLAADLRDFPLEILSLADSLEILDLSNNQLTTLPASIAQLKKLKIVFASNNHFTVLPDVLGECENLEMVGFKANKIHTVSASSLPAKLRWLTLTDNHIESLPEALGERPHLQKLLLAGNRLRELPESLRQCKNLELLRISANQLSAFPAQVSSLPKLAWIAFSGNPFSRCSDSLQSVPLISSSSYHVENVLGQGASGIISKATWTTPQTEFPNDIAVKVFKGKVTSDGYPEDEMQACLKVGSHPNLVSSLAQVKEADYLALVMRLIPAQFRNLGLPPSLDSCTRDTFPADFTLSIEKITKVIEQMRGVFAHLHAAQVCHGDLYAHNTLVDEQANVLFGDFGAASMYHMLSESQQQLIKRIEGRALAYFIDDLLKVCAQEDSQSDQYQLLRREAQQLLG
tara:strand:- start:1395 stop:2645 length:1251 start_codon:yes stop_codon:yes gene_type:complete